MKWLCKKSDDWWGFLGADWSQLSAISCLIRCQNNQLLMDNMSPSCFNWRYVDMSAILNWLLIKNIPDKRKKMSSWILSGNIWKIEQWYLFTENETHKTHLSDLVNFKLWSNIHTIIHYVSMAYWWTFSLQKFWYKKRLTWSLD